MSVVRVFLLFVAFFLSILVSSQEENATTTIRGKIVIPANSKDALKNGDGLKNKAFSIDLGNIQITLNGGERSTFSTISGDFAFFEVPAGVYSLDVNSIDYVFSQLKIKVSNENTEDGGGAAAVPSITVIEFKYPGAQKIAGSYPLVLTAIAKNNYLPVKEGFSLYKVIMGNPMALMAMFSIAVVVGMPMLMKNMDPEELKAMQQRNSLDPSEDPTKLMKQMMGLETKEEEDDE